LRSLSPRTQTKLLVAAEVAFDTISTADCPGFFYTPVAPYDSWECSKGRFITRSRRWQNPLRRHQYSPMHILRNGTGQCRYQILW
jgi:hypothetical protein